MLSMIRTPFAAHVARFVKDESGFVTVDYVFMTASVMATTLAVISTLSQGVEGISSTIVEELSSSEIVFMSHNFGRDRETALREGPRDFFSANAMGNRYNIFSDPAQRTEAQVRNAHRTWSRRMNDVAYSQPGRAADMVRILDQALEVRDIEPHTNI